MVAFAIGAILLAMRSDVTALAQGPALGDEPDWVMMAGGAVRFSVPPGWSVAEIPHGRHVRLWLVPGSVPKNREPRDGIWMTFHWRNRQASQDELREGLEAVASRWSTATIDRRAFESRRVGTWDAVSLTIDHGAERDWRLMIPTGTGVLEIAVTAPVSSFADRRHTADQLLRTLTVTTPAVRQGATRPEVADAADTLGLWKSLRGRLRLSRSGRIEIRFDDDRHFPLDASGVVDYGQRFDRLTGRFEARHDMLWVTWDDGSRLNYRWRIEEGQLLLTDHHGRVSQLTRLID